MFDQCSEDSVIPFDLPVALMAVLRMWDELEEALAVQSAGDQAERQEKNG